MRAIYWLDEWIGKYSNHSFFSTLSSLFFTSMYNSSIPLLQADPVIVICPSGYILQSGTRSLPNNQKFGSNPNISKLD